MLALFNQITKNENSPPQFIMNAIKRAMSNLYKTSKRKKHDILSRALSLFCAGDEDGLALIKIIPHDECGIDTEVMYGNLSEIKSRGPPGTFSIVIPVLNKRTLVDVIETSNVSLETIARHFQNAMSYKELLERGLSHGVISYLCQIGILKKNKKPTLTSEQREESYRKRGEQSRQRYNLVPVPRLEIITDATHAWRGMYENVETFRNNMNRISREHLEKAQSVIEEKLKDPEFRKKVRETAMNNIEKGYKKRREIFSYVTTRRIELLNLLIANSGIKRLYEIKQSKAIELIEENNVKGYDYVGSKLSKKGASQVEHDLHFVRGSPQKYIDPVGKLLCLIDGMFE